MICWGARCQRVIAGSPAGNILAILVIEAPSTPYPPAAEASRLAACVPRISESVFEQMTTPRALASNP